MKKWRVLVAVLVMLGILTTSAFAAGQWSQKSINVKVNPDLKILVNGNQVTGDVEAFLYNDRVMVPLRAVSEALGADVAWEANKVQVVINQGDAGQTKSLSPVAGTRIIPHALSADGKTVLEPNMMARDYASIVLAQSWVAKNAPKDGKTAPTRELVRTIEDALKLFVNGDGSVKVEYELVEGAYKLKGDPAEVRTQAYMGYGLVYPHHAAMEGNYDMAVFGAVHKDTATIPIKIAAYSLKNLGDNTNGGFYKTIKKDKKDLSDQAFGLYSVQPLVWLWQKHPDRLALGGVTEKELRDFAIKTDDFLKKIWSEEYGIYADTFNADGSNPNFNEVKYDLRTVGYLLWGHSLLHNLINDVDPQRAAAIEARAKKFLATVVADGVTYKPNAGIPREIKVTKGVVGVSRDETNTGRLFDFVHAVFQYQRTIKDERALQIAREMVVLGANAMQVDGVLIHDFTFSDPSKKNPVREVPYLGAYVTAAERLIDRLDAKDQEKVRQTIKSNYDFILKEAIR